MANVRLALVSPIASGGVAHFLDTSTNYTAGNLFEWRNNGVVKASVAFDGTITGPTSDWTVRHGANIARMIIDGSLDGNGGEIILYGSGHATLSGEIIYNASKHTFKTLAGVELMALLSGSVNITNNVGIGQAANTRVLSLLEADATDVILATNSHASAPNGVRVYFSGAAPNDGTQYFLWCEDSATVRAKMLSNGGLANYQANNVNLSDERLKDVGDPVGSVWDAVRGLDVRRFRYRDNPSGRDVVGLIAQQVARVAPELVSPDGWTTKDGVPYMAVYSHDLQHYMLRALQECMARIERLEG